MGLSFAIRAFRGAPFLIWGFSTAKARLGGSFLFCKNVVLGRAKGGRLCALLLFSIIFSFCFAGGRSSSCSRCCCSGLSLYCQQPNCSDYLSTTGAFEFPRNPSKSRPKAGSGEISQHSTGKSRASICRNHEHALLRFLRSL